MDLQEVQSALNASQIDISTRFIEFKDEITQNLRTLEQEISLQLRSKTNRDPQNDEAPLLTAITQAKQHQQATPYFKQLLLLATHRLKKLRLATAQKTIETILTSITTANTRQHPLQGLEYTTILAEAYTVQAQLAIVQEHPTLAIQHYQQALTHWESMADTAPEVATLPLVQCHAELMHLLAAQQQETVALNHAASILKRCPIQPNALITGNTNALETLR